MKQSRPVLSLGCRVGAVFDEEHERSACQMQAGKVHRAQGGICSSGCSEEHDVEGNWHDSHKA